MPTILSDFLNELQVPHTAGASDRAFHSMPFTSLFGFSRLLAFACPTDALLIQISI